MNKRTNSGSARKRLISVGGIIACIAAVALSACMGSETTSVTVPSDHLNSQDASLINDEHANCQGCHSSMNEEFCTSGALMTMHEKVLSDYDNGETTDEATRIMSEHGEDMAEYFASDTIGNCNSCHQLSVDEQGSFRVDVTFDEFCMSCHDDYDYIIEQTADWGIGTELWDYRLAREQMTGQMTWEEYTSFDINPHTAHGTNASCSDCHKIHQEEESFYCTQCHIWSMPGDDGSETYSDWGYDQEMYRNWRSDNQFSPNENKQE